MLDRNNREIRTGDFVKISGAYFATNNGLWLVTNGNDRPGDPDGGSVWLDKVKKNGELCVERAGTTICLPLSYYCSDWKKNRAAREHDRDNLRYEVIDGIPTFYAAKYFRDKAANHMERYENCERLGNADPETKRYADWYNAVADRLAETAVEPKQKAPEVGIKFYANGIKVDGGRLIPCWYGIYGNEVHINAKDYGGDLPTKYFVVQNDSDIYTDYFCKDSTTLTPEHPLYRFARYAALKRLVSGKTYRNPTDELRAEYERTKDPGQPTAKDIQAVEDMKTAQESARKAKEHAEELERREETLRKISEGRHYIESVAAQHPIKDGEPTVEITFSESPYFYSFFNGAGPLILSVAAADEVIRHYDDLYPEHSGYDKTDFLIRYNDPENGESSTYEGRYDIGDHDGGLIEHIRAFGRWNRTHDQFTGKEVEHNGEELSDPERLADYLDRFTPHGSVVSVSFAPWLTDYAAARESALEAKKAQQKQDWDDIMAEVGMLTDEQLAAAVLLIPANDKEHADVARFFLQQLHSRDERMAIEVFKKWQAGETSLY